MPPDPARWLEPADIEAARAFAASVPEYEPEPVYDPAAWAAFKAAQAAQVQAGREARAEEIARLIPEPEPEAEL